MSELTPAESSKRSRSPSPSQDHPNKKQAADTSVADVEASKNTAAAAPAAPQLTEEEASMSGNTEGKAAQGKGEKKGKKGSVYEGKKRDWDTPKPRPGSRNDEAKKEGSDDEVEGGEGNGEKRLPKKKAAIMLGYCGAGYSGMQIQTHGSRTIEGDVFEALVKAGAVSAENSTDHRKVDVQRAARTDAGVHAAGNVISMKMILAPPLPEGYTTLASYVNSFLPPSIRMWGFVRTMKSFAARTACDSRKYEYLLPSYCLLPPASGDTLSRALDESSPGWRDDLGPAAEYADAGVQSQPIGDDGEVKEDPKARGEFERRRAWRIDEKTLTRFRTLVAQFKGTHNFHNYTLAKPFNDRSVKRHMITLKVNDPVVVGEIEWISVQIHGQSFMLHQIRKMLSLAMLACRTNSPPSLIPETFGPKRIHIPKAPPLGLLLEAPQFGLYNRRIHDKKGGLQVDRDPIDWDAYAEEMQAFKLKYIYDKLREDELETHVFHKWIRQMDTSDSEILSFLNSKGVIPPEAEVSKRTEARKAASAKEAEASAGNAGDGNEEPAAKKQKVGDVDSDDEDVDQDLLKRGELEG